MNKYWVVLPALILGYIGSMGLAYKLTEDDEQKTGYPWFPRLEEWIHKEENLYYGSIQEFIEGCLTSKKKVISGMMKETQKDIEFLTQVIEEGKFTSVIDRTYTLEETDKAHEYVETGRKKGNVLVTI